MMTKRNPNPLALHTLRKPIETPDPDGYDETTASGLEDLIGEVRYGGDAEALTELHDWMQGAERVAEGHPARCSKVRRGANPSRHAQVAAKREHTAMGARLDACELAAKVVRRGQEARPANLNKPERRLALALLQQLAAALAEAS
jgi:hypothetical protein